MFHIERDGHHSKYTCISNAVVMDKRLTLAARGFFAVVLALPDSWDFSVNGMARFVGVNKDTVLRYIRELEQFGYVRVESRDETGRYARKSYIFYETAAPKNTALQPCADDEDISQNTAHQDPSDDDTTPQNTAFQHCSDDEEEPNNSAPKNTAPKNSAPKSTAPKNTVPKSTAQSSTDISNNINKQNTVSIGGDNGQKDLYFLEKQINADILRDEYGSDYIGKVIGIITDCMNAKSRTISGERVDNQELVRVFGEVCAEDIRKSVEAVRGKQYDNFSGYFGSVLFNQIKNRMDKPQQPRSKYDGEYVSSIDFDEVMRNVMAKYRNLSE